MSKQVEIQPSFVDLYKVDAITLSVLSADEARNQSVVNVKENDIYDDTTGEPKKEGINDYRMGTMDLDRLCNTCMGSQTDCPGHFGHIELCKPVFHANLLDYSRKVLKAVCFNCSHLLADNQSHKEELKGYAQISNAKSRFNKVYKLSSSIKTCAECTKINHGYKKGSLKIDYEIRDSSVDRPGGDNKQTLWPEQAKKIFENIKASHLHMLGLDKERSNPTNMIISILAVAPPPVRPSVQVSGSMSRGDDDLTIFYNKIVKQNNMIQECIRKGNNQQRITDLREGLQFYCAALMSNTVGGSQVKHKSGQPLKAIRERLKGKEGRLRGNLMGKRCDFTARSVITCDPNLRLDQLGVPEEIAKRMTIPEVVTSRNIEKLRILVENGADTHPGAKFIQRTGADGRLIDLSMLKNRTDQHLEIGYTVERHLQDDDYVIFNRQPSLHKMSMMGHRIKVLKFQTFRLNLSVTTPYNADFDGDEMNMHVPQSLETKAEIKEIMAVPKQIVAPQSNKPCMGIVQDALLGINRMTSMDTFIEKHVFMNILMFVDYDIEKGLPQPAVICRRNGKLTPLWTGKQVISLVIPDTINFERGGGNDAPSYKDEMVIVQQGELISGILGKKSVGNVAGGLIHIIWKDLGPKECCDILSNIQLVVNNWLVNTGFTVGVADIIAKQEILNQVKAEIKNYKQKVRRLIYATQVGKLKQQPGKNTIESFEHQANTILNEAREKSGKIVTDDLDPSNRLRNMVYAESKGSNLNISQIMACVGQQNVEGKRIPFGFNRRTLPHFIKDDFGPESRGFVENCYLVGLSPSEFYFHAMGGREGVIDTAVKTADTGYISRRLMKALEDVMVKYDGTVRTSREILVQFLYGEDGMAGEHFENIGIDLADLDNKVLSTRCDFNSYPSQERQQRELVSVFGAENARKIMEDRETRQLFKNEFEQIRNDRDSLREMMRDKFLTTIISPVNIPRIIQNVKTLRQASSSKNTDLDPKYYFEQMKKLQENLVVMPEATNLSTLKNSHVIQEAHQNSTMLFKICIRRLLCSKKIFMQDKLNKTKFDQLLTKINEMFRAAIVHPGEMVGSVAANSIGEPATQMTLNTFHNAGISSKNVTLGVPRLREVINVAKTIKAPSLKIFIEPEFQKIEREVDKIGKAIQFLNLSHIVSEWGIYYDPDPRTTIIEDDKECLEVYQNSLIQEIDYEQLKISRWVLRFVINDKNHTLFDNEFRFDEDVCSMLKSRLNKDEELMEVVFSANEMTHKVIRMRLYNFATGSESENIECLRELAETCLDFRLRGIKEIAKYFKTTTDPDCVRDVVNPDTGARIKDGEVKPGDRGKEEFKNKDNFIIETDGTALLQVLAIQGVDATRTTSNSLVEILQVFGIEATRNSLIKELREILGTYGIYVNYRHLSTLVDIMTLRGILTSITRHGINRTNCGAIRKCTFEETTEILLEAAFFGEKDPLSGISENIIFGQLAPYGTGCFDLVVDNEKLANCIENNQLGFFNIYQQESDYTPIHQIYGEEIDGNLTPQPIMTPMPWQNEGGQTSQYYPQDYNDVGGFTPVPGAIRSPVYTSSPGYGSGMTPTNTYGGYNQKSGAYMNQQTGQGTLYPTSGQTPNYYHAAYNQSSGQYSPLGGQMGGGSSYHPAIYSPTNMNVNQTPNYSPTTSGYYQGMTPRQHSTPSYNYGNPTPGNNAYTMPKISSPSMNPVSSSPQISSLNQMNSAGHLSGGYGQSPSALPPIYGSQYSNVAYPGQQLPPVYTAPAYNPETAGNQDQSDSDD